MAQVILEGCGGRENIVSIDNCITRLRLEVRDHLLVDEKMIKSSGREKLRFRSLSGPGSSLWQRSLKSSANKRIK